MSFKVWYLNIFHCLSLSCVQPFATQWIVVCSPPGFSVHGILQARILEWVAFSRGSSPPKNQTQVSCIVGSFFTIWAPGKSINYQYLVNDTGLSMDVETSGACSKLASLSHSIYVLLCPLVVSSNQDCLLFWKQEHWVYPVFRFRGKG